MRTLLIAVLLVLGCGADARRVKPDQHIRIHILEKPGVTIGRPNGLKICGSKAPSRLRTLGVLSLATAAIGDPGVAMNATKSGVAEVQVNHSGRLRQIVPGGPDLGHMSDSNGSLFRGSSTNGSDDYNATVPDTYNRISELNWGEFYDSFSVELLSAAKEADEKPKYGSAEFRAKSDAKYAEYDPENTGRVPDPINTLMPFMKEYVEGLTNEVNVRVFTENAGWVVMMDVMYVEVYVTTFSKNADGVVDRDVFFKIFKALEWDREQRAAARAAEYESASAELLRLAKQTDAEPKYFSVEFRAKSDAKYAEYDPANAGRVPDPINALIHLMRGYGGDMAKDAAWHAEVFVKAFTKSADGVVDKVVFFEIFKTLEWLHEDLDVKRAAEIELVSAELLAMAKEAGDRQKYACAEFRAKSDAKYAEYDPANTGRVPDPINTLMPFMKEYEELWVTDPEVYIKALAKDSDLLVDKDVFFEMFKSLEWHRDREVAARAADA